MAHCAHVVCVVVCSLWPLLVTGHAVVWLVVVWGLVLCENCIVDASNFFVCFCFL